MLAPIVELRDGEGATALLMFTYSFLAMTAYNAVKPITRSAFIRDLGADNLPYVLLGLRPDHRRHHDRLRVAHEAPAAAVPAKAARLPPRTATPFR